VGKGGAETRGAALVKIKRLGEIEEVGTKKKDKKGIAKWAQRKVKRDCGKKSENIKGTEKKE